MNERHSYAHAVSYLNSIEFKADGASHKKGIIITDDIRDHTYSAYTSQLPFAHMV